MAMVCMINKKLSKKLKAHVDKRICISCLVRGVLGPHLETPIIDVDVTQVVNGTCVRVSYK